MSTKLSKKGKKSQKNAGLEIVTSLLEYSVALFAILLCVIVPLYMQDGYYKIGTAKFNAYAHIFVFGMPLLLVLILLYIVFQVKDKGIHREGWLHLKNSLSVTDWFVIAFFLLSLLSYFASGYLKDAFFGYDGWYMGIFAQLSFVLLYFVVSRFGKDYQIILTLLCGAAFYAFVLGILHRLLIDPIGVYTNIDDYYKTQFLSTLGQASWYSSFVCTVLPIGMVCFYLARGVWTRVLSGIFTFAGFATLVTQNSDSAYIAFTAMILILLFVSVSQAKRMQRLCEILFLFSLAPKFMWLLLRLHPNYTLDLDTLSSLLIFGNIIWALPVLFGLLWGLFVWMDIEEKYPLRVMKLLRNIVYGLALAFVMAAIVILMLSAKGMLPAALAALTEKIPYLTWDNSWGNGRGFTWSFTGKMIAEMSAGHKLFGVGPDSYAAYAYIDYSEMLNEMWGSNVLTNAHNEWLNMIVDYGFVGAAAYIGIFISALVRFVKNSDKVPMLLAVAACIGAYMGHNLFCYQQVLCTPFIFLFMALGEYQLRKVGTLK